MWMGNRLMVGHRTLTPYVQVRILVPQGVWLRSRETVSRRAHNPKIGGSIPSSATKLIGSSLIGRASDSESEGYRFESYLPSILIFIHKVVSYAGMVELVDTLGLEPSALRCAGSSPVPGIWLSYEYKKSELRSLVDSDFENSTLNEKSRIKSKKSLENGSDFIIVITIANPR